MKNSQFKKMVKALELLKKSQSLMAEVEADCEEVRYDSNTIMRHNSLVHVISIMESTVDRNSPDKLVNNASFR